MSLLWFTGYIGTTIQVDNIFIYDLINFIYFEESIRKSMLRISILYTIFSTTFRSFN